MTKLITKLSVSFKSYLLSGTTQTKYLTYLLILLFSSMSWGQTNPTPFDLSTGSFTFASQTATSTTYPTNMQGWSTSAGNITTAETNPPSANYTLIASGSSSISGLSNLGTNGFQFLTSGNASFNKVGSICVALNTTGRQSVQVSWTAADQLSTATKVCALALQYRIGISGSFTTISGTTYSSSAASQQAAQNFTNISLPSSCENQAIVQIRWIYYEVSGSGGRDPIRLDDITVSSSSMPACSGTPAPGNTLASVNPVVSGSSSVLSLQNATSGTGVNYQWKSSTDNVTYTNISGATSANYTATPSAATYYICDVTCSGVTTTSNPVQVTLTYCTPIATSASVHISSFSTSSGITNISNTTSAQSLNGYGNFTAQSVSNFASGTVNYSSAINGVSGGVCYAIFIDWNNDFDFADSGEKVIALGESSQISTNPSGSFVVPVGTPQGNYRMRVVLSYATGTVSSCYTTLNGEVEDYTFTVVAQPTCMVPTALTSSAITYQTATIAWAAPTLGTSPANYEYEVRTSGAAGSGASGLVASGTITAPTVSASVTGLSGATTYTYFVRSDCGDGDFSIWSNAGTFTTLSCNVPTAITSSALTYTSATIGWTAPVTGIPAGYEYEVRTSGAAESGTSGLITSGTTTSPTITAGLTGLTAGTTYSVYVRSNCYSGFNSAWTSVATFTTIKIEPTNQITSLSAGTVSTSAIPLTWTAAVAGTQIPDGYLVKASDVDLPSITDPVDGTDPSNVTVFTTNAANKKQTTGTATSTTSFTGMNPGTMYYYKVYSYTNSGTGIDFKTDTPATLSHATKPNGVSSSVTSETITSSSIGFTWSSVSYLAGANEYIIFAKAGSVITSGTPVLNPSTYTANATFGSGTAYEADASAFCVYKGDGASINLTGLNPNTTYHFLMYAVVDTANSNGTYSYSSSTAINRTTSQIPAQLPYIDNFTTNNFIFVNGTTNIWSYGSAVGNPANAIYISNDSGISNAYTTGSARTVHAYRDIVIPSGATIANFSFDWKSLGEVDYDYLRVWLVPTSFIPTAGTQINSGSGRIQVGANFQNVSTWQTYTNSALDISSFTNTTMRLVFEWRNDLSGGSQSPAAVDNISLMIPNNTWTGVTSSSWSTASNWSLGTVPTSSYNIVISSNTPNAPVMDVDVTIPSGKSLTLSGTGSLSVAPGKVLTIAGTANFNGKAVIFKSDAAGAGMFGPLTTGTLTGATNVQVERFIPARRAYRFLSPSVTTSTTIRQNWQEDGVNTPGFGTHITGATGASAGFDPTETNNSSLLLFNSGAWVGATSTNVGLTAGNAYCLMVRGDRTTDLTSNTPTASNTVLRATGTLFTGNFIPALSTVASGYSFIGNPYQAPLDIKTALQSSTDVNKNVVYYWDPTINARGGYITRNLQTSQNIPASSVNDYVQPGQAFFVVNEPTLTGTPALTFTESHKSVANAAAGAFRNANSNEFGTLRVNLQANTNNQWATIDGTLAIFNDNFSWNVTSEDATKMTNLDEEVSFVQNNTNLAIALQSNPSATSELPIKIGKMRHTNYQWQFELNNYSGATPYLFDTLNNSYTQINNGTAVPFTADSTTTNRFKVVFQNAVLSNATFQNTFAIYPNPAKAGASFYVDGISEATVTVSNLLGQNVPVETKSQGNSVQVTPSASLSKGVYLVNITSKGNTQQVKWIVE